jgi:hypothetical protein
VYGQTDFVKPLSGDHLWQMAQAIYSKVLSCKRLMQDACCGMQQASDRNIL